MYLNKIKMLRIEKGFTMAELAELSEVSVGYICHLENGTRKNPSFEIMKRIAKALNTDISEIFFE